jgi:hypothetical protein
LFITTFDVSNNEMVGRNSPAPTSDDITHLIAQLTRDNDELRKQILTKAEYQDARA